jgi:hypothetical protein
VRARVYAPHSSEQRHAGWLYRAQAFHSK